MGIEQVLVDPARVAVVEVGHLAGVELASGQHDLADARCRVGSAAGGVGEDVAVRVDVTEAVVVADQLHAVERWPEGSVVPQAQVLDRRLLGSQRSLSERRARCI